MGKSGYRGSVMLGVAVALFAVAVDKGYIDLPALLPAAAAAPAKPPPFCHRE
jgi:hypothetical protein